MLVSKKGITVKKNRYSHRPINLCCYFLMEVSSNTIVGRPLYIRIANWPQTILLPIPYSANFSSIPRDKMYQRKRWMGLTNCKKRGTKNVGMRMIIGALGEFKFPMNESTTWFLIRPHCCYCWDNKEGIDVITVHVPELFRLSCPSRTWVERWTLNVETWKCLPESHDPWPQLFAAAINMYLCPDPAHIIHDYNSTGTVPKTKITK